MPKSKQHKNHKNNNNNNNNNKQITKLKNELKAEVKQIRKSVGGRKKGGGARTNVGRVLGSLGDLTSQFVFGGSGTYNMTRGNVSQRTHINYNTLLSHDGYSLVEPPAFNGPHVFRFRKIEYLGDIFASTSTTAFTLRYNALPINPTNATLFPWLATVAQQFSQYRFHGLIFMFKSTSTQYWSGAQGALGAVAMATDYNSSDVGFTSKQQMLDYENGCDARPDCSFFHPVECAPRETALKELYCAQNGADIRFVSLGDFTLATQGQPTANVNMGELYVSYDIEFFKPQLTLQPVTIGGTFHYWFLGSSSVVTTVKNELSAQVANVASTSSTVTFANAQPGYYLAWLSCAGVTVSGNVSIALTNCSQYTGFLSASGTTVAQQAVSSSAANVGCWAMQYLVVSPANAATNSVQIAFSNIANVGNNYCEVFVIYLGPTYDVSVSSPGDLSKLPCCDSFTVHAPSKFVRRPLDSIEKRLALLEAMYPGEDARLLTYAQRKEFDMACVSSSQPLSSSSSSSSSTQTACPTAAQTPTGGWLSIPRGFVRGTNT